MKPQISFEALLKHPRALRLAVVCGGPSPEANVSRASSRQVVDALASLGHVAELFEYGHSVMSELSGFVPDVVFPVMHGGPGEDGTFQGAMEVLGIPYVGSGVLASKLAMQKPLAKLVFRDAGLPVIEGVALKNELRAAEDVVRALGVDLVAKPCSEGSGLGVTFCSSVADLESAIADAQLYGRDLMVERRIVGMEVTVGVLDTLDGSCAFAPIEVATPAGSWYDFEHRYTPGLSDHILPARLSTEVLAELMSVAVRAHRALDCRDLSRSDFLVDERGGIFLLELNSLPGMTATSLYPEGASHAGISFPALLDHLVCRALARGRG